MSNGFRKPCYINLSVLKKPLPDTKQKLNKKQYNLQQ